MEPTMVWRTTNSVLLVLATLICIPAGFMAGIVLLGFGSWLTGDAPIGGPLLVNSVIYGMTAAIPVLGFWTANRAMKAIESGNL